MARKIGGRLLRARMDRELLRRVNYTKLVNTKTARPPTNTQLARLRVILRAIQTGRERGEADLPRLREYLGNLRNTAKKQFEPAKVDEDGIQHSLLDWLTRDPGELWTVPPLRLGRESERLDIHFDPKMAQEYALRLIDQVIYRALKENTGVDNGRTATAD